MILNKPSIDPKPILEAREILKRESLKSDYKMTPRQIKLYYQLLENLKHGW